jgi:hypothetical protein
MSTVPAICRHPNCAADNVSPGQTVCVGAALPHVQKQAKDGFLAQPKSVNGVLRFMRQAGRAHESARSGGQGAKNCAGDLPRSIGQWLAMAVAVNLDALNLAEMDQALLDADYYRAAGDRFAPA